MDELEVLNFASNDNVAILVSQTNTKKIMVISHVRLLSFEWFTEFQNTSFLKSRKVYSWFCWPKNSLS